MSRSILKPRISCRPVLRFYATVKKASAEVPQLNAAIRPHNPVLAEYLKTRTKGGRQRSIKSNIAPEQQGSEPQGVSGKIGDNSLFGQYYAKHLSQRTGITDTAYAPVLDPRPDTRKRWQRRHIIKEIRMRGRLPKAVVISRTERSLTSKSAFYKTSIKKLYPLANQIAGKSIEEAIVQMRFSKKKNAEEILKHLEVSRDKSIKERGLGLGKVHRTAGEPVTIRLKDGTKHLIKDRTQIYVDQAWVGRGAYGMDGNPRARGRVDRLRLPQTSKCSSL